MKLNYSLNQEDILKYYRKHLKDNSFLFKNYVFGIALLIAPLIRLYSGPSQLKHFENDILVSATYQNIYIDVLINFLFIVVFIFLMRFVTIYKFRNSIGKNPSLIGERELELTDDKLELITKYTKSEYSLLTIKKIVKHAVYYYLYIDNQIAIIIPISTEGVDDLIKQVSNQTKIHIC